MEQVFFNFPISHLEPLIKKWFKEVLTEQPGQVLDEMFGMDKAVDFLGLGKQTIYNLVSQRSIPHHRKGGRLYFSSLELTQWLKDGKRMTNSEIKSQASNYTSKNK